YLKEEEERLDKRSEGAYRATKEDIRNMVKFISSYSLYAYEDEMKRGFITIQGGHRIGVAGQVVMEEGKIRSLSNIYFLNIRVAREKRGCAKEIVPYLIHRNSIYNTLFVSPPGVGKTTYLRDVIRILSSGTERLHGMKVSIIDERSEIAACKQGIPQNDVGPRSDVLDGCLKSFGMLLMLRSMAPQVIAVDEIGSREDCSAMEQAIYSGSKILGTVHAYDMKELSQKKYLKQMIEQQMFGRIVLLEKGENGRRRFHIYNENLEKIC
ncbi:MAG: stage III sporulation protein AA, partial [Lachnospiraceae bacterium]